MAPRNGLYTRTIVPPLPQSLPEGTGELPLKGAETNLRPADRSFAPRTRRLSANRD